MTTVLPWQPGQAPYVTPDQLYTASASGGASQWPTGVQWGSLPSTGATPEQQAAVLAMLCQQGTTRAEEICNQPLRATIATEELQGPHFRVTVQWHSKNGRIITSRWPVLQVLSVEVCANASWPRVFNPLPAGFFEPEFPVPGLYGTSVAAGAGEGAQSIICAPGYINWMLGRNGWRVRFKYLAGWPHTTLTAAATAGADTIQVDDCTGWAPLTTGTPGAYGIVYDAMSGGQETVSCTAATAQSGPGTLTLASPLNYGHAAGIMVSSMPQNAIWATALLTGRAAMQRGATATTVQTLGGRSQKATPGGLHAVACDLLHGFRRTE